MSQHLLDAFMQNARLRPDAIALRAPNQPAQTWAELTVEVNRTRQQIECLADESVPRGTRHRGAEGIRIVYESRNLPADIVIAIACMASGVIEIPIDARLPTAIRRQISSRSKGIAWETVNKNALPARDDFASALYQLEHCAARVDPHQPSLVLWTSGTTAQPRGVMLSQHNLTTNAKAKLRAVPQCPEDIRLTLLSIAHAYARTCDMGTWLLSGCVWTLDYGTRGLERIDPAYPPTMINCVPVVAREIAARLASNDQRLHQLAVLGCGGAAMDRDLFVNLRQHGIEVIQGYGCTETSPVICSSAIGKTAEGLVGPPVDDCEIRIRDRRLFVRGPNVMLGYLDDPEATAAKIDENGWLDTGDLVECQPDGQLRILGRADDVIVLENGFKLHPLPIEQEIVRNHSCEYAVVLSVNQQLIIALQIETLDQNEIASTIEPLLPPNTSYRCEPLVPPLSLARGELTPKKTPRRRVIATRFVEP